MTQIIFTTALQVEALPLIKHYGLEKIQLTKDLFLFRKDNISCLTTGVGKKNVRKRLKPFLEKTKLLENSILINVGIAGGNSDRTDIGQMVLVNQIIDEESDIVYDLDICLNMKLKELPLMTVNAGVVNGGERYYGLVDMEASAIYETALHFLPSRQMCFLKIVSDYMDKLLDRSEQVLTLVENQLLEIHRISALFSGMMETNKNKL